MFVAQAHSFTQQARLAITLAWVAGYTNTVTFLTCNVVTSHTSGTLSQWGRDLGAGDWRGAIFPTFILVTFVAGAMLSSLCLESGRRRGWESIYVLPATIEATLLAAFAIGVEMHQQGRIESGLPLYLMTGVASLAMGLQNATTTRISGGVVRTTHMTGVLTDLGLEGVQFLFWVRDRGRNSPPLPAQALVHSVRHHPAFKRLVLLVSLVGSFALGAALGIAIYRHIPQWAMVLPVGFLIWVVIQDLRVPICEIEESEIFGIGHGDALPEAIAVYHLRKDKDRHGRAHRLPDLLRWCERLPMKKRVVILDLGEAAELDTNAALELRALMHQSSARGRRLILSGVTGEQYENLRQFGAADTLDSENVCPDLELAIARGLVILDGLKP